MARQGPVTLDATIERVFLAIEGTGWTVARARAGRRAVTIVGTLPPIKPGETWRVEGVWTQHPRYGEQVQIEKAEPVIPSDERGLEAYLASAMVWGPFSPAGSFSGSGPRSARCWTGPQSSSTRWRASRASGRIASSGAGGRRPACGTF